MKFAELDPRWWGAGGRRRLGVSFLCPHCQKIRLGIAFANPSDGGEPSPIVTTAGMPKSISVHIHARRTFDVPPGFLWHRDGEDFETMSLTPSVDASQSGHWHGFIRNGEVS